MSKNNFIYSALLYLILPFTAIVAQPAVQNDINANFKSEDLDVELWSQRFEVEGREVYDFRNEIIAAIGIKHGQTVADVGAGTGLFIPLLAEVTGDDGKVYAVDISSKFIDHLNRKAKEFGLGQVETILSSERTTMLPENSVDFIFTSDSYHHFIYYQDMLASMHKALKPGGQLIIVDFDISSEEISPRLIEHVGATNTKEILTQQILDNNFNLVEDFTLDNMKQSFMRRFKKN